MTHKEMGEQWLSLMQDLAELKKLGLGPDSVMVRQVQAKLDALPGSKEIAMLED